MLWLEPIGRPKTTLSFAYLTAAERAYSPHPIAIEDVESLSALKTCLSTSQPLSTSPSTFSSGTHASSM